MTCTLTRTRSVTLLSCGVVACDRSSRPRRPTSSLCGRASDEVQLQSRAYRLWSCSADARHKSAGPIARTNRYGDGCAVDRIRSGNLARLSCEEISSQARSIEGQELQRRADAHGCQARAQDQT